MKVGWPRAADQCSVPATVIQHLISVYPDVYPPEVPMQQSKHLRALQPNLSEQVQNLEQSCDSRPTTP